MTDNELIAEFMGFKQWSPENELCWYEGSYLKFDSNPILTKEEYYNQFMWSPWSKSHQPTKKKDLKYHSSWDCLMSVVEAIEEIEEPHPSNNPERGTIWPYQFEILSRNVVQIIDNTTDSSIVTINRDGISKIQAVYKAVVEFIKWYNQTRKQ